MSPKFTLAIGLSLIIGATACDPVPPPPPPVVFTVTEASADLHDAVPGDGICSTSTGVCTLRAALEESAHHARSQVLVAVPEIAVGNQSLVVSGDVELRSSTDARVAITAAPGDAPAIVVEHGAILRATRISLQTQGIEVSGVLLAEKVGVSADAGSGIINGSLTNRGPALHITADGVVVARNSEFSTLAGADTVPSVRNEGTGVFQASRIGGILGYRFSTIVFGNLETAPGAVTTVLSTYLGSGCVGVAPNSSGYNAASDASCALSGVGDIENASAVSSTYPGLASVRLPAELLDALPVGVKGCGETLIDDFDGNVRPAASSQGNVNACDIGSFEKQPAA